MSVTVSPTELISLIIYAFGFVDWSKKRVSEGTWGWLVPNKLEEAFCALKEEQLVEIPKSFRPSINKIHFHVYGPTSSKLVSDAFSRMQIVMSGDICTSDEKLAHFEIRDAEGLQSVFQAIIRHHDFTSREITWIKSAAEAVVDYMLQQGAS